MPNREDRGTDLAGQTVGLFGGSFDPTHVAHLMVANYLLATTDIERVLVVPTFEHALAKRIQAPFDARLRMARAAFAHESRVTVSEIESELGAPSRTLTTLIELQSRYPGIRIRLVIGSDILQEVERWHRWDRIVEIAPPLVIPRFGFPVTGNYQDLEVQLPEVSSTEVRRRIRHGESVRTLVPKQVVDGFPLRDFYAASGEPGA